MIHTPAYRPIQAAPAMAAVDQLLLRKLLSAARLLMEGELAAAQALLTHVTDVADANGTADQALVTTALRLMAYIPGNRETRGESAL
jgi:hypothetical protein